MSESGKAVFLSYASQDAEAAKKICDALRAAGVEVWFDQNELVGGDAWDAKIRRQIKECALFVPVISAATQARMEGYFRREWRLAVDRMHDMDDGHPFLLPVVIDDTPDAAARVPERFRERQWTRLPSGVTPPAFGERVKKLLSGEGETGDRRQGTGDGGRRTVSGARESGDGEGEMAEGGLKMRKKWLRKKWVPLVLALMAYNGLRPLWRKFHNGVESSPAAAASPAANGATVSPASPPALSLSNGQTEAQKLIAQVWVQWNKWEDTTRGDWQLADENSRRAVELERNNSEAWAVYAQIGVMGMVLSLGPSEGALAEVTTRAQRAVKISPDSFEPQFALANCYRLQGATRDEAERIFLSLLARSPNDGRVMHAYAGCLRDLGRIDEALRMADRAAAQPDTQVRGLMMKANILGLNASRMAEAEAVMDQVVALGTSPAPRLFKITILLYTHGDLDRAAALLAEIPPAFMLEERGAVLASQVWLWRNEPDKAIAALKVLPDDLLVQGVRTHGLGVGPRAFYIGQAQQLAGRPAAAQSEWRAALNYVNGRLAAVPNSPDLQYWRAYLLASLGDRPGATEALKVYQQLQGHDETYLDEKIAPIFLLLDRIEPVVAFYTPRITVDATGITRQILRYDPALAALRADPRIKALLAANASGPAPTGALPP